MLFLTLLAYLVLFAPVYLVVVPLLPFVPTSWLFAVPLTAGVAAAMAVFCLYVTEVYHPEGKQTLRRTVRKAGVRWIAGVTAAVLIGAVLLSFLMFEQAPAPVFLGLALPAMLVSFANAGGYEFLPKRLRTEIVPEESVRPAPPPLSPVTGNDGSISKAFRWSFESREFDLELRIAAAQYEAAKARQRVLDYKIWSREYVLGGMGDEVRELARSLYQRGMSFGTYREVSFVLAFVQQCITYREDVGEYPKYPIETLVEEAGDCEDYAILGAAILKQMGYEVAMLYVPGHAALGVAGASDLPGTYAHHGAHRYYYCEMTASGWQIGVLPSDYKESDIEVSPVPLAPPKIVLPQELETALV